MSASLERRTFVLGACGMLAAPRGAMAQVQDLDVPYVPTRPEVVEAMLDLAELRQGERLIDLGSGDGRIAIAAARRGAQALGVEREPRLVQRARMSADLAGQQRARFLRADLFTVSLRDADIVTLYLLPAVNERLKPKLLNELRPGARVVSHAFDMGDWGPDASRTMDATNIFLWTIPAIAGGTWRLQRASGSSALLAIEQRYNHVAGMLDGHALSNARLQGTSLSFVVDGVLYRGIVGERAITSEGAADATWTAERVE